MNAKDELEVANGQDKKQDFLDKKNSTDPYLQQALLTPRSPYQVMAGGILAEQLQGFRHQLSIMFIAMISV